MTLTIHCDHISDWKLCPEELSGMAFNAKPASWLVVDLGHGDHRDYCPEHARLHTASNRYSLLAMFIANYGESRETFVKDLDQLIKAHNEIQ
jgi:hypothetical protein